MGPEWEALQETLDAFAEKGVLGFLLIAIARAVVELPEIPAQEKTIEFLVSSVERRVQVLKALLLPEMADELDQALQAWILTVRMIQRT